MKVLYFSKGLSLPVPGPQSVAKILLENIKRISKEIEFICVTDYKKSNEVPKFLYYYLNNTIPLPEIPLISFKWENFLSSRLINKICRKYSPDLIHVHGYAGYYPSPPTGFKSLLTFHDFPPMAVYDNISFGISKYLHTQWLKYAYMIRLKRISDYTHFQALSSEIMKYLQSKGISQSNISLIPNGIHTTYSYNKEYCRNIIKKKLNLSREVKILTMVGTITYRKGVHFLKNTLESLPSNYHLVLLGSIPKYVGYQYLKFILKGKCSDRIHYLGYQSPDIVRAVLTASDCFLSLSISEACQLSPLEAILTETPVIITKCGAAVDFFGPKYEFLLPIKPKVHMIREKIIQAIETLKISNHLRTKFFSWNEIALMLKDAYFSIVNK